MSESIGQVAGVLWHRLDRGGPSSLTKIAKDSDIDIKQLQRALGWLAREDKVDVMVKGRTEIVSLKPD